MAVEPRNALARTQPAGQLAAEFQRKRFVRDEVLVGNGAELARGRRLDRTVGHACIERNQTGTAGKWPFGIATS